MIVHVPRFGTLGGDLIRKLIKEKPISPKRMIIYELLLKLMEFVGKFFKVNIAKKSKSFLFSVVVCVLSHLI